MKLYIFLLTPSSIDQAKNKSYIIDAYLNSHVHGTTTVLLYLGIAYYSASIRFGHVYYLETV